MIDWNPDDGAAPLFATARNLDRRTDGGKVGVIARHLGTPLIPWQDYVAHVANERRPDGSFEYQVVVVSVPRQTGKTTLLRANGVKRCLVDGRDVFYTAQTGKDARARWMDLVKVLRVNPALRDRVKVSLRGGSENVAFTGGGAFHAFAPLPQSLHGYTPPTVKVDEAFALSADAGDLLMGAITPAQQTVVDRQIWIVSTAGTAESTFLHDWIDLALEGAPRVALFLWGAAEHHDPYSLTDIAAFHPGVGHVLNGGVLTAETILEAGPPKLSAAEYERAYANRRTVTSSHLIALDTFRDLARDDLEPPVDRSSLWLGFDVAYDRQSAAVVAAWHDDDLDATCLRVVRHAAGYRWLEDELPALEERFGAAGLVCEPRGPVLEVLDGLRRRGVVVDELPDREFAAATTRTLDAIRGRRLRHGEVDDAARKALEAGYTGLVTRPTGDGVVFSRRRSIGDVSTGIAGVVATWRASRTETDQTPLLLLDSA